MAAALALLSFACQPVIARPPDEPPWLGIAQSPQMAAFIDSGALRSTATIVHSTLRFRYAEPQVSDEHRPFVESRTTVEIDCAAERGRTFNLQVFAADGSQLEDVQLVAPYDEWKPYDQHPLSTYFLAACIRMGRVRGRLVPNMRLKLPGARQ